MVLQRSNNPEQALWFTHADDLPCNQLLWFLLPEVIPSHLSPTCKGSGTIRRAEPELPQPGAQWIKVDKHQFQLSLIPWVSVWSSAGAVRWELSIRTAEANLSCCFAVNQSHLSIRAFSRWLLCVTLELSEWWCSNVVNRLSTLRYLFDTQWKFVLYHWCVLQQVQWLNTQNDR